MVHHSIKVLLVLILQLNNVFGYIWMDHKPENQIYDELENQKFISKKFGNIPLSPEIFKRMGSANVPVYKTSDSKHCNCELNFEPLYLGPNYYPRYLHTGICQPNSCEKYYQCVEKKYNVKVLRKKDNDDILSGATLPKPLRDFWVAETIPVGVACKCVVNIETFSDAL